MPLSRERDVERQREDSRNAKDVYVPQPADMRLRRRLEADDEAWLRYYFSRESGIADPFWYEFTAQQKEMIAAIRRAISEGGDQAIAASRGEGKTTICERMLLKYVIQGITPFAVLFASTGEAAANSLDAIKDALENNDLLLDSYPEVCVPVRALENTPNRAHYMTVSGKRLDNGKLFHRESAKFTWCGREVVLPAVPGAPASRAVIATRGLDAAVRGLKKKGKRPSVAIIDDPDTEETARSEEQARKLEDRIDRAIGALGGQQKRIARVLLTTLQSRTSASYKFTGEDKPSFRGRRFRFLVDPPLRQDLWEVYVALRRQDLVSDGDTASAFYDEHYAEMNAGASVSNENRYVPPERSALQFYFNEVARLGQAAVATEYDNDPPEDAESATKINPRLVQCQLSGLPRGVIPADCKVLTHGVDVGKWRLHWVVRAWKLDGTGYTIDYGVQDVSGAKYGSDEGLDAAIRSALLRRFDEFRAADYAKEGGEMVVDPLTVVDASYRTDAVYSACATVGAGCYPIMGFGQSPGCVRAIFSAAQRPSASIRPGDGWKMVLKGRMWLIEADADRWKAWEHDRWTTAADKPGCMFLFGRRSEDPHKLSDDERSHLQYAQHICAEVEVEEIVKGVLKRRWKPKSKENHYLDSSYYANVAANVKGVRLTGPATARPAGQIPEHRTRTRTPLGARPTAQELANRTH